jgi:hypothetical protein
LRAIGGSVGLVESVRCQISAAARDAVSGRLAACDTCNEVLLVPDDISIDAGPVRNLHAAFALAYDQVLRALPRDLVARHLCALHVGGQSDRLNIYLVHDPE